MAETTSDMLHSCTELCETGKSVLVQLQCLFQALENIFSIISEVFLIMSFSNVFSLKK